MKIHPRLSALVLFTTLAGCATFDHQTTEAEPHALVTVVKPRDSSLQPGMLRSLDGQRVSPGKTYRLRPGGHAVVVEFTETVTETARPKTLFSLGNAPAEKPANLRIDETGRASVSGAQPFQGMQPASLTMEVRRVRAVTNSITVQAGGHYELVGDRLAGKIPASR